MWEIARGVRILAAIAGLSFCSALACAQEAVAVPSADADFGPCSANFQVRDEAGQPVSGAKIKGFIPYHIFSEGRFIPKIAHVQVVTNDEGKARIVRLPRYPQKGVSGADGRSREVLEGMLPRTVVFKISHDQIEQSLEFDPEVGNCERDFDVTLGKAEAANSETGTQ